MGLQPVKIQTEDEIDIIDITEEVEGAIPTDHTGVAVISANHTTAAVIVNEAESRLTSDIASMLKEVVEEGMYRHDEVDDNAAAHLRACLLSPSVVIPVADGRLATGTWQSVMFVECDGPRSRTVTVVPLTSTQS